MNEHEATADDTARSSALGSVKSNLAILFFGVFTLLFLIAIDHEEWFHLRPMSGVAVALSQASQGAPTDGASIR